jgi:hypothetical protein
MNYTKPEVAVLGDAACVIQGVKGTTGPIDGPMPPDNHLFAAYDLDE